jgi:aminomethyltransferase
VPVWAARTGYTGEDGFEVYLPAAAAADFWQAALDKGGANIAPVGLGARDTLRLEAGMPLYGNEIDRSTHPFEAGIGFAVKLDKAAEFVGKPRLAELRASPLARRLRGFRGESKRIPRQGMSILLGDEPVGRITSGAPSPTLCVPIAMGYLSTAAEAAVKAGGRTGELAVDLRGRRAEVSLVPLPFYSHTRRASKG